MIGVGSKVTVEADTGRDRMSLWQKHSSMAIKIFDCKSRREIQSFLKSIWYFFRFDIKVSKSIRLVVTSCTSLLRFVYFIFLLKENYLILFCLLFRPATATAMQRAFDSSAPTSSYSKSSALHSRLHPTTYPRLLSLSHPFICYFLYLFSILSLSLCYYYIYTHVYIFRNVCVCAFLYIAILSGRLKIHDLFLFLVLPSIPFLFFSFCCPFNFLCPLTLAPSIFCF